MAKHTTDRHGYNAFYGGGRTRPMRTFWKPDRMHERDDPSRIPAKYRRLRPRRTRSRRSQLEEDHGLLKLVLIVLAFVVCVIGAWVR